MRFTYTTSTLTQLLATKGYPNSGVVGFYVSKYTRMGNVLEITFVDSSGKRFVFDKSNVRTFPNSSALGVVTNSPRYSVTSGGMSLAAQSGDGLSAFKGGDKVWTVGADGNPVEITLDGFTRILSGNGDITGLPVTASSGTYVVDGRGWGHNVGMSQYGAKGMAEQGYTYDQILRYYFTGVTLEYIRS